MLKPSTMNLLAEHPFIVFFFVLVILLVITILAKRAFDAWQESTETASIKAEVDRFRTEMFGDNPEKKLTDSEKTSLELREYYTLSKRQAKTTFSSAMLACYVGFGMFGLSVVIAIFSDTESDAGSQYSAIGGAVVEIIAGLFFWMYTKANEQMKSYYDTLLQTYRFQEAIDLADELDSNDRNQAYAYIISQMTGNGGDNALDLSKTEVTT